ncbi:hypothetical protein ACWEOI_21760 [Nocardia sp. NPDC004340]
MVLVGALFLGLSFAAAHNAQHPRCDGHQMSSGDTCLSSRSGAQSRDQRAASAASDVNWMRPLGLILIVGGLVVAGGGMAAATSRR